MARQSQIIQPSQDDLLKALMAGQTPVDTSAAVEGSIRGEDLASTILKNKQAQEDRVRTLAEKIRQAKMQKDLAGQIGAESPLAGLAASVDPTQASKQKLEQYFTEKAAKAPKPKNYTKYGETADEIILADPANPADQYRIKAPGLGGNKSQGRGDPSLGIQTEKDRANRIILKVDQALKLAGPLTTGPGSAIADIPVAGRGTNAQDLKSTIDTIKGNLAFQQLTEMRRASPTGGALGQIAVRELELLEQAVSSLDPQQSEDRLRANLAEVKTHYQNWLNTVAKADQTPGNGGTPPPAGNPGQNGGLDAQKAARLAELRAKRASGTLR